MYPAPQRSVDLHGPPTPTCSLHLHHLHLHLHHSVVDKIMKILTTGHHIEMDLTPVVGVATGVISVGRPVVDVKLIGIEAFSWLL